MKFVLIVIASAFGGSGMNGWQQPVLSMVVFEDAAACTRAAKLIEDTIKGRQTSWHLPSVTTLCVPQGSDTPAK